MKKKVYAWLLALLFVLPIASSFTSQNIRAEEDVPEVLVWNQIFESWNQDFFTEQGEKYNTLDRGYKITQEFIPGDAWTEKLQSAQATGSGPDTRIAAYNQIYDAAKNEAALPLDDFFSAEQLDDILPNVRDMVGFDGKVYAYPQLVEPSTVLYYRTDLFEEAGIEEPPKTWDELVETAKKLQSDEVFGLGIPGFGDMGWSTWGWQMQATGHLAISDNWDEPMIDEGYIDLANLWKSLYDANVVPAQALGPYPDLKSYGEGALAMTFGGSWGIGQLVNDYPEIWEKTSVAVPPTRDGSTDKIVATNGGWCYLIDALSEVPEGAADYMSWLLAEDPETCAAFFAIAQYAKAAPRQSVVDYIAEIGGVPEHAEIISEIAERSIPEPQYPWDISLTVANMFEQVAIGGMPAEDAAAEANDLIQTLIDNENLAGTNPRHTTE